MTKAWIVEVACLADFDDLDSNDLAEDGTCAVNGAYRVTLDAEPSVDPEERILDVFHAIVPIGSLDDFEIMVREQTQDEAAMCDGWLRRDLGVFPAVGSELPYLGIT